MSTEKYLSLIADAMEALAGATTTANHSPAGYWKRIAAAAEILNGVGSSAADDPTGYMKRAAVAIGDYTNFSGTLFNAKEEGYLAWMVAALEDFHSTTVVGSLEYRLYQLLLIVDGPPAWLTDTAIIGINFVEGKAWLNDTLITDLTTILGGDFDPGLITLGTGYDMTAGNPGVRGTGSMLAIGDLLTRLQAMDWAFLIEWDLPLDFQSDANLLSMTDVDDTLGAETYYHFGSPSSIFSTDWEGDYNPSLGLFEGDRNRLASSNNVAGWTVSTNGNTAVVSAPQSTFTPVSIAFANSLDDIDVLSFSNGVYGTIRSIEFFNLKTAGEVETLATPSVPDAPVIPAGATSVSDFVNRLYWDINRGPVLGPQMWEFNHDYNPPFGHDSLTFIPGVGYQIGADDINVALKDAVIATPALFTAVGAVDGLIAVIDYTLTHAGAESKTGFQFDLQNLDGDEILQFITALGSGVYASYTTRTLTDGTLEDSEPETNGTHRVAILLSPDAMQASTDAAAIIDAGDPDDFAVFDTIGITLNIIGNGPGQGAIMTITSIVTYPHNFATALTVLSA